MELFRPLHLLIILLVALMLFGIPGLLLFLLARWCDKNLQRRPGVRVSIVGITVGGITDVVATNILAIPVVVYTMAKFDLFHTPQDSSAITNAIHTNPALYGLQLLIGLGCSVLGGYVAARIAKHDELLNGALSSFLCIAIGVYSLGRGKIPGSLSVAILLLIASPLFAFLGGYLRILQKSVVSRPT
jgi:hypothetical protein